MGERSVAERAAYFYSQGEKRLLTEKQEAAGVSEMQGAQAIAALVDLAYAEGMMAAEYGHPSKRPAEGDDYWGDFLFDSSISWTYAEAIAKGASTGE